MVLLAGMATWIEAKDGGRIGMGVTLILTISTLIQGLKSQLPKVSYLTALDIYLWVCFGFVFLNVGYLKFYIVLNFTKKVNKNKQKYKLRLLVLHDKLLDDTSD